MKGSQFQQPLLEFHGACAGCGETRMLLWRTIISEIRNCQCPLDALWGLHHTQHVNYQAGRDPSWGRSLFEDYTEYGFGMVMAAKQRRKMVVGAVGCCCG